MDTVGDRIRRIRELRGLSQKELASRAGIHEVLMRRYEYGDRNPKADQLAKIAHALRVPEAFFSMPKVSSSDELFSLLFELIDCFGDISLEMRGGDIAVVLPMKGKFEYNPIKDACRQKESTIDPNEFQRWLLNYRYSKIVKQDLNKGEFVPIYPEIETE